MELHCFLYSVYKTACQLTNNDENNFFSKIKCESSSQLFAGHFAATQQLLAFRDEIYKLDIARTENYSYKLQLTSVHISPKINATFVVITQMQPVD